MPPSLRLGGLARGADNDGGDVSAVDVLDGLSRNINQSQEHRKVLATSGAGQDHMVERFRQVGDGRGMHRQSAKGGLQVRHHHGRADSFAFHVRNDHQQGIGADGEEIVIIASHVVARLVCDRNVEARYRGASSGSRLR